MCLKSVITLLVLETVLVLSQEPVVFTEYGKVKGVQKTTSDGSALYVFSGIPYAEQPLNGLRFKDPKPLMKSYSADVFEATKTTICVQYLKTENEVIGQEDCLTLNIYTTTLENTANYDVLVFIHGGLFSFGAGHLQSPEYLYDLSKNLVFVSLNYRLGPFGFLSTGDEVVPGNMGLKDQAMALKWIKTNIKYFGGNPENIVLMGTSSGATSVHLHYMSPGSRDLFAKGISMSGSALSMDVKAWKTREGFDKLATLFPNCQKKITLEIVECLTFEVTAYDIVEKLKLQYRPGEDYSSYSAFGPVVESGSATPFLDEHPFHLLRKGKIKSAPYLVGATSAEGFYFVDQFIDDVKQMETINEKWTTYAPNLLRFKGLVDDKDLPEISNKIKQHYIGNEKISFDTRNEIIRLFGDRFYMTSMENSVRLHAAASRNGVYMYMFDYRGKPSFSNFPSRTESDIGPSHADDLIYILKMEGFNIEKKASCVQNFMISVFLSFIKDGIPGMGNSGRWPAVSRRITYFGRMDYVLIDNKGPKVMHKPNLSDRVFWDTLPLNELHVSGDLRVPKYIDDLQRGSWWLSKDERKLHVILARILRGKPFANFLKKVIKLKSKK